MTFSGLGTELAVTIDRNYIMTDPVENAGSVNYSFFSSTKRSATTSP